MEHTFAASPALVALIEDYLAAGVDCALDETPHDRFTEDAARSAPAPRQEPAPRPESRRVGDLAPPRATASAMPPEQAAVEARTQARQARNLDELRDSLAAFEGAGLRASAKSLVFADGSPAARLMLVGEAPGAEEDRSGRAFVGRPGRLLDRMLAAIGLDRETAYLAHVLPWRPPGNRAPTAQEMAVTKPFLERQIELAAPDLLVCLGDAAAQVLLDAKGGVMRTRGRWFTYMAGERPIPALVTLAPSFLLKQPSNKRLAWRDLRALKRALDEGANAEPGRSAAVLSLAAASTPEE